MASCFYTIIWKGSDGVLSIPFNASGYSDVSVSVFTYGDIKIDYGEGEFTIEDGYINIPYEDTDLDILPDGVLRYVVDFKVDGYDGVIQNNFNQVLKTPEDYTAADADAIWNSGYTSGYTDGLGSGTTEGFEEGYQSGSTDGFQSGYTSGYTDGLDEGFSDGYNEGFSDGEEQGFEDGYESGTTNGFNEGYQSGSTDGFNEGYQSGTTDGFETGHSSGYTEGFGEGYDSGSTDGFNEGHTSGYTDGENHQKSLLGSTAITLNGDYTNADGWSAVSVDIAQTGHTDQEITDAFNSGFTGGYNEGYGAGEESGITYQKSLLSTTAITVNGDYSNPNGWSAVSVTVAQTGYTQQDLDNAFNAGYLSGQSDCSGYTQEDLDEAYSEGFDSGYTTAYDEFNSGSSYNDQYLTFDIISGGTIVLRTNNNDWVKPMQYSTDRGYTWTTINPSTGGTSFNVNAGDKVWFKGTNERYGTGERFTTFGGNAKFDLYGNSMSLLYGDNFQSAVTLATSATFYCLFSTNGGIQSAENLILPATACTWGCYNQMFVQSTLTKMPKELPATVLAAVCYERMFHNCWNLVDGTAPILPAPKLEWGCYEDMFNNANNVTNITCLATDISAQESTLRWVWNVAANGTFTKDANMNDWTTGENGIPANWTVINASA